MDTPGTTLGETGTVLEESTMMQNNPEMSKGAFDNSRTFSILLSLSLLRCSTSSKPAGAPQARSGEVEGSSSCCSRTRGAGADFGEQRCG